jgi:phage tail sheath protein FI
VADYTNKAPGVYIEEIPAVGPIQGVGTSTAAFIGTAARSAAPTEPTVVTNWTQYKDSFGEYDTANKLLPYAIRGFFDNGGTRAVIVAQDLDNALAALSRYIDVDLVVAPEVNGQADQLKVLNHCRALGNRFAILSLGNNVQPGAAATQAGPLREPQARGYGALYYPWILVSAPREAATAVTPTTTTTRPPATTPAGTTTPAATTTAAATTTSTLTTTPAPGPTTVEVPPVGHIAGIYARSDALRGVHKAPANEVIRGALGLVTLLNDTEHGTLNAAKVNALRIFPNSPPMVWGSRSLSGNLAYHQVNVERLLIYIERSLEAGLRWAVFEPNDFSLWKKLERTIREFLTRVWRSGALFGRVAEQAFYIKVDEEVNTPVERDLGKVIVEVGVAPVHPAEFVVIRLALQQGGANGQG